ncbi:MAG TPA: DUF917 domain-containing protein [Anaerovoracaceae bacterium]|nr:DUF917 domain-containing protein [Anaerovoracaceae bacterium]
MRKLDRQDLHDILLGAAIVGTGGGGSLARGIELVDKAFDEGHEFLLAEIDEIPDDALIGTPYGCGSIGPLSEEQLRELDRLPKLDLTPEVEAVKGLENYLGKSFYGVVATELGGGNTAAALDVAARIQKPLIDADPAGRSVPCLQHTTYYLKGLPITPMCIADQFGDTMILAQAADDARAEALTRAAAVASFNHVGVVDHPAEWGVLKDALLHNTITMCLEIGQTARKAREAGRNYAYDVAEKFGGYIVFEGTVTKTQWEDTDGFTFGNTFIKGEGKYKGDEMRIWFQNENIMSWKNEKIFATVPDSINIVNTDENMPLLNPYAKAGMKVTVFVLKAFEEWRSPKGMEVFGPEFFGYDIEYKKIEDIMA